jgi:hypothetical protein
MTDTIATLVATWPKRATVRSEKYPWDTGTYNPGIPDYPIRMVPFASDPRFQAAAPEARAKVLSWAWVTYNERTILAEDHIANPALVLILQGAFGPADDPILRQAVQQMLVDEHFHTLIHTAGIAEVRQRRGLSAPSGVPDSVTRREFLSCIARAGDPGQRAVITLAFALVAEVSVNAYLELLSSDQTIQPLHRLIPYLHNRDEYAHGQLIVEVAKVLYAGMSEAHRRLLVRTLPDALRAYARHDYSAWRAILARANIADGDRIAADCEHVSASSLLVRDFSGLRHLAEELEILDVLDFEFAS